MLVVCTTNIISKCKNVLLSRFESPAIRQLDHRQLSRWLPVKILTEARSSLKRVKVSFFFIYVEIHEYFVKIMLRTIICWLNTLKSRGKTCNLCCSDGLPFTFMFYDVLDD